jgi:hypothetical protein
VLKQPARVVVHVHRSRDVHRVHETECVRNRALAREVLDLMLRLRVRLTSRKVHSPGSFGVWNIAVFPFL